MTLYHLQNPIRTYAWGSRTTLAELQGRPAPSAEPEAELWIGAHPTAPSLIGDGAGMTLLDLIDSDPVTVLGPGWRRLPFLLKLLAVEQPLSLQVHPDAEQAATGYAAEQAAGLAPDDPNRSYHDDQPKPELICALTPFTALCGFADPAQSAALLDSLGIGALHDVVDHLRAGDLRSTVTALLTWPEDERATLVSEVLAACTDRTDLRATWTARLARAYPDDTGVITSMLLNLVELAPGQALYLPGRTLHAYLYGTGVEIMAASDNVLRGGLTPKNVNVPELLSVTDFNATRPEPIRPTPIGDHGETYIAPAPEFRLTRLRPPSRGPAVLRRPGPGVVLCTEGTITVRRGDAVTTLTPGLAAFLPHDGGPAVLSGEGVAHHAAPGTADRTQATL
ncbi:mannose-6-phosphate isomerase, class I [Kitasatospora sp. NBC_00240]|uniref:mannose-6-phosphate isomerase, class I n=1 Tax=Kitasatospora sp. NBC_00240 TaxID=2903567 RepID=UPI002250E985|nr:mannose-6-phosphate isomerase, class I [Kitasatospora sp. NBC_00240]MCX5208404.1 mannose-6-phosphate isomerase, class I [Kitasatospora sp. NBC_00240]